MNPQRRRQALRVQGAPDERRARVHTFKSVLIVAV